jgi:predicted histidine transporter YuiF (NhaC family)
MDNGLKMVIGMSLAYITSFAGLLLAFFSYKKHHKKEEEGKKNE